MVNNMRYVLLIVAVLSLLLAGCATEPEDKSGDVQAPSETGGEPAAEPAGETVVDVEAVDDALVEDDLEQSMDSIDLDDW